MPIIDIPLDIICNVITNDEKTEMFIYHSRAETQLRQLNQTSDIAKPPSRGCMRKQNIGANLLQCNDLKLVFTASQIRQLNFKRQCLSHWNH